MKLQSALLPKTVPMVASSFNKTLHKATSTRAVKTGMIQLIKTSSKIITEEGILTISNSKFCDLFKINNPVQTPWILKPTLKN